MLDVSEIRTGIELNPRNPTGHHWYGSYLEDLGRLDEAIAEIKQALELDPLSLIINTNLGDYLYVARRYDEAIGQSKKTVEINPEFRVSFDGLGRAYLKKRMFKEAIEEFQKNKSSLLIYAYATLGKRAEALRVYEEWKKISGQQRVEPVVKAIVYLGIGEIDLVFNALEKAYQERYPSLLDFIKDPNIDVLRPDSRFKALLKKMNLPEFWSKPSNK